MNDERIHCLVVYTCHDGRKFSVTARKREARLPEVNAQMERDGFETIVLATNLPKDVAERFKATVIEAYRDAGYEYVQRESL